jgi:YbbR domain-containing protein
MGRIATKPVDLGKAKESLDREVELEYDMKTYRCEPNQVRVRISISQRGSRMLPNIPPTILSDAPDLVVEVHPKAVSLKLEGPLAILDTLSTADVSILLDLSGRPAGSYTLSPEIIVPNGVERYSMSVDSLRVILHREQESK